MLMLMLMRAWVRVLWSPIRNPDGDGVLCLSPRYARATPSLCRSVAEGPFRTSSLEAEERGESR